ncbi:hypothetical protein K488DRAFT_14739, partial [Vararia minispora EC-137]
KRKKSQDDDDTQNGSKKARTRVRRVYCFPSHPAIHSGSFFSFPPSSYSCGECHRRKQKASQSPLPCCDRQIPCSHCRARKVPELCKAYTPGKPDQDIHLRLARLEHIIEIALPQYATRPSLSNDRRSVSPSGAHSQADEEDLSGGTFQSGRWYGNSASGSVAPGSLLEQLQNAMPGNTSAVRDGTVKAFVVANVIDSVRQDAEPTPADNLKALIQDCGVPPHKITELVQELPPQRLSTALIDHYFTSINWTRYPISERDFRQSYASVCANGVSAHPNDVRFLPLLFVVLAISVRLSPEHIGGDARSRRLTSLRYYWASRRSLLIAAAIQPDSLDMVLTRLLSARFLTFDRRITECWSQLGAAVRTAQALGLHRDGGNMARHLICSEPDNGNVEYRRRVWAYLYHADRSYALVLGRPNAIQDVYTSTHPPLNVEDEISLAEISNPPPLTTPTRMTFVILRHTLAVVIGKIVHHYQQVRHNSHYSDVLALDEELLKFLHNLPPHYSMNPDTSLDETLPFVPAHRCLLITEILFVRISLHRPYLLRRLHSDRYARSREACFESATQDYTIRCHYRERISKDARESLHNAYRDFQSTMVAGIYLLLKPKGRLAYRMHAMLDDFLKEHEGVREMDETTRRELKIIEFFKAKSTQMLVESDAGANGASSAASPAQENADAQLLLGIQHAGAPRLTTFQLPSSPSLAHQEGTSPLSNTFFPSPTIQRIQSESVTGADGQQSTSTGSPGGDDESAAQNLLDHWYNAVSAGPVAASGGPMDAAFGGGAVPWGGFGSTDLTGWFGTPQIGNIEPQAQQQTQPAMDTTDWSYFENLVNEIRGNP